MIRRAHKDDLPLLCGLLEELFSIEEDFTPNKARQAKGLELLLCQENATIFVAEEAAELLGMATVQLVISTAEGGPAMLIEDVVVRQQDRGKGIGSALLEAISKWGAKRGAVRMQLLADRSNEAALHFYSATCWQKTQLVALRKFVTVTNEK